jgi:uncharacterized protein (DUF1501 family)
MNIRRRSLVQVSALILALAFIIAGVAAGDAGQVFKKAIVVCLECIGIGST